MSKMKEYAPNWPLEDWQSYYRNTAIRSPLTGVPALVMGVNGEENGGTLTLNTLTVPIEKQVVPIKSVTWAHLRHPPVGWIISAGIPVYYVKLPLREKTKGFRTQILKPFLPKFLREILGSITGHPYIEAAVQSLVSLHQFYDRKHAANLQEALAALANGELAVTLAPEVCLIQNPDPKTNEEFFALLAYGPSIAARVRRDTSVEQIGAVDISDVLYNYATG